ncbi:NADH-quinone oxidoreductase subunit N [Algimonas ampicilliniresistens]|jgi:NADH-quinone oxidoreductase subunit N|uniref:NADH-quinone oxidoreductase subunit N n=1 Tax=Algimonas ampicilliniresistens TaxID=1298735 RepID=A0ABQ5V7L1_9PROT|nr:NADH-quinone oxidoreductase subunit NuoN [Algimonas ampicilliniresistens]GLQ23443.1 NADH-quinone oxidoreductase subunit N [Algimonas ampicilliniresistens]
MEAFSLMAPELLLAGQTIFVVLMSLLVKGDKQADVMRWIAIAMLITFALTGFVLGRPEGTSFNGLLIVDDFSHYAKLIIGLTAALALVFSRSYFKTEGLDRFEFSVLMIYAVLGMSIMVSANNLLALYLGLEMQALALYIMAAFNRDSLRASEAGLKYFVLGALSSGLLLYGMSLIYGFTGHLDFAGIAAVIEADGLNVGIIGGMVFMMCGLAFKISAAPFHMWTPDVYEGAPTPVTGFFASVPKFAAMALIARLLFGPLEGVFDQWQQIVVSLALVSMFVGAIGALSQRNIKRLMAYSSIANMGYALVPLAAGTVLGLKGMLIFMTIYVITSIGVFSAILQMRIRNGMVEQITDLSGLSQTNRGMALVLTVFFFSLAGIPFFLGFFGKWYAFGPALQADLWWLVVAALVASVIGAFYYLRVIKTMWFEEPSQEFVDAPRSLRWITTSSALILTLLILLPFVTIPAQGLLDSAAAALF